MPLLRVEGLKKAFGKTVALRGVSFHLEKGEILGVLGPNGAGKTTLIHCILGLIEPTEGRIEVFGAEFRRYRTEILQRVNFASSYISLPYSLTVRENLTVYAHLYGVDSPQRRVEEVMQMFDIHNLRDTPARKLSTGQMMRLVLAKAMINHPELLLLDEPTAGLDPEIAARTRRLLCRLRDESGISVLYTSHNLKEMEEVSDRVLFLHEGRVIAEGRSEELLRIHRVTSLEELFFKVLNR
jgi:ABC-2 type transport system ATP-binding protein